MNDDDNFVMSLNDTLACGLGACILLFIVFVILINVDGERSSEKRQAQKTVADIAYIATGDEQELAKPSLLVRLRGACHFVKTVKSEADDFERSVYIDARDGKQNMCVTVLFHPNPPIGNGIELRSIIAFDGTISRTVTLTATWGGQNLTSPEGSERELQFEGSGFEKTYALATVYLSGNDAHISWAR